MPPILMLSLCAFLVVVLLWIERKDNPDASTALWIPTIYMLILGSRPLGTWVSFNIEEASVEDGSPLDRWVLSGLIVLAIYILSRRSFRVAPVLKDNLALLSLLVFLGISILWSDHQFVSLKRWIRVLAVVPIGMVVLTEKNPLSAMESIFRRCAYILIPFSIILAKYFPTYGVSYGRWSGMLSWNGATLTKNSLAHLCLVVTTFMIWSFIKERANTKDRRVPLTQNKTLADGFVFAIAVYMLFGGPGGFSATSTTTFVIIAGTLILIYKMKEKARVLAFCLVFIAVLMWPLTFFSDEMKGTVHEMVGRSGDTSFTGRSDAWDKELEIASRNPILGVGFGSFWGFDNEVTRAVPGVGQTGHNGLLDANIEVGIVGVGFIIAFLIALYRKSARALNSDFDWGVFGVCFVVISIITNFTESLFIKSSSYIWNSSIFLALFLSALQSNKNDILTNKEISHDQTI